LSFADPADKAGMHLAPLYHLLLVESVALAWNVVVAVEVDLKKAK